MQKLQAIEPEKQNTMGCAESVPVEVAPPEPVPKYKETIKQCISSLPGEPTLLGNDLKPDFDYTSPDEPLLLIFRKIGASQKGDTFQVEELNDELFHSLQVHPAKPGVGIKKRLEDLVFLHPEGAEKPLAYSTKNVTKGLEHYILLRSSPLSEKQQPAKFDSPLGDMYLFAMVEFGIKSKLVSIRLAGQKPDDDPLFTMRQCSPSVWVIKKHQAGIYGVIHQVRGMAKLTCFRLLVVPGADPALVTMLAHCVDSFLATAKTQRWNLASQTEAEEFDWPALEPGMEDRLFGKKVRWWPN